MKNKSNYLKLYTSDKEYSREYHRTYRRNQYHNNSLIRTKNRLQCQLAQIIRSYKRSNISAELNYTILDLLDHFEKQFTPEMTWQNYGTYWEIDHITQASEAKDYKELVNLFSLSNLRPLEKKLNRSRGLLKADLIRRNEEKVRNTECKNVLGGGYACAEEGSLF
jgi:hypothetical protein